MLYTTAGCGCRFYFALLLFTSWVLLDCLSHRTSSVSSIYSVQFLFLPKTIVVFIVTFHARLDDLRADCVTLLLVNSITHELNLTLDGGGIYIALVAYSYSYFLHVYVIFFFPSLCPHHHLFFFPVKI